MQCLGSLPVMCWCQTGTDAAGASLNDAIMYRLQCIHSVSLSGQSVLVLFSLSCRCNI